MASFRRKTNVNISRVISKIVVTVFTLYVGGTILTEVGSVMTGTDSAFYKGLSLIGWTVEATTNATATSCLQDGGSGIAYANCITSTSGSGILVVVGLVAIASIVMEFVEFKL